jgi:hypothetical protein
MVCPGIILPLGCVGADAISSGIGPVFFYDHGIRAIGSIVFLIGLAAGNSSRQQDQDQTSFYIFHFGAF